MVRIREEDVHKRVYAFYVGRMVPTRKLLGLDALERLSINEFPEWMVDLKRLKILAINCRRLPGIPEVLGNMTDLEELEFWLKGGEDFPLEFGKLKKLVILKIHADRISDTVDRVKQVKHLELGKDSRLKSIPHTIGNLRELRHLHLVGTESSFLPGEIGNLSNLEVLNLSKSHIKSLPQTIGNLKSLTHLNLSGMKNLRSLPEEIGRLANLQNLDCRDYDENTNFFVPSTILNLKKLRVLHLSRGFHEDDNNRELLSRVVGECLYLGCLGCEKNPHMYIWMRRYATPEFLNYGAASDVDMAHQLMYNRINTRLFASSSSSLSEFGINVSLWPLIIAQTMRAMARYACCNPHTLHLGCGKQLQELDAIYHLLLTSAPGILQERQIDSH